MLDAADLALSEVQQNGMSRQTAGRFWCRWLSGNVTLQWSVREFAEAVREGLAKEGEKIAEGETLLGSSDVIESLFGKYKEQAKKSPQGELGASVLLLSLLVAQLSNEEIIAGLETVSVQEMKEWLKEELGESPQARKRHLFGDAPPDRTTNSDGPKVA